MEQTVFVSCFFSFVLSRGVRTRHRSLGVGVEKHNLFASMKSCFGSSMVVDK